MVLMAQRIDLALKSPILGNLRETVIKSPPEKVIQSYEQLISLLVPFCMITIPKKESNLGPF